MFRAQKMQQLNPSLASNSGFRIADRWKQRKRKRKRERSGQGNRVEHVLKVGSEGLAGVTGAVVELLKRTVGHRGQNAGRGGLFQVEAR